MTDSISQLEERVALMESALAQVRRTLGLQLHGANWVNEISGSLADMPEDDYQRFLDCCRAVREDSQVDVLP